MPDTMSARSIMAIAVPAGFGIDGSPFLAVGVALSGRTNATQSAAGGTARRCDIVSVEVAAARLIAASSAGDVRHAGALPSVGGGASKAGIVFDTRGKSAFGMTCIVTKPACGPPSCMRVPTYVSHADWLKPGSAVANAFAPYKRFSTSRSCRSKMRFSPCAISAKRASLSKRNWRAL